MTGMSSEGTKVRDRCVIYRYETGPSVVRVLDRGPGEVGVQRRERPNYGFVV